MNMLVVGGGIGGLTTAAALSAAGHRGPWWSARRGLRRSARGSSWRPTPPGRWPISESTWDGFSLTMGLLLIGYGAVTVAMERIEAGNASRLAPVLGISSLLCLAALGLSATHFFAVPVLFTTLASASFALDWRRSTGARIGAPPPARSPKILEDG